MTASAIRDSLESGTRWSTSTPSRRPGPGPELGHGAGEVVNAVQGFDDDALHPEVVTPDLFHEFGVVLAFHPDPAGLGHLGALPADPDRAGGRAGRRLRRAAACAGPGGISRMGCPSSRKPKPSAEGPGLAPPVLQRHHVHAAGLLHPGHGAHPAGLDVLEDHPAFHRHFGQLRLGGGGESCGPQFWYVHLDTLLCRRVALRSGVSARTSVCAPDRASSESNANNAATHIRLVST